MSTPGLPTVLRHANNDEDEEPQEPTVDVEAPYAGAVDKWVLQKRGGSSSSPFWKFFHTIEDAKGDGNSLQKALGKKEGSKEEFCCCNLCGNVLKYKMPSGKFANGSLQSHLQNKHHMDPESIKAANEPNIDPSKKRPGEQQSLKQYFQPGSKRTKEQQRETQELAITKWIAETIQPFSVVTTDSFRQMLSSFAEPSESSSSIE